MYKLLEDNTLIKLFSYVKNDYREVLIDKIIYNSNLVSNTNRFFLLYREYIFICFLWIYSIKLVFFFKLSIVSMPNKKKIYTVLRSPHKDKKSREKFQLTKIKKAFSYPSFLHSNLNLSFINSFNEQVLISHHIKKIY